MNSTINLRRIQAESKQLESLGKEYDQMFDIKMVADNMFHWQATIYGPIGTLYANYEFILDITLPADYPKSPILVKFITPIQHININTAGDICLDILKDKWIPALNITSVLISIISLLGDPNPIDPLNSDLAGLYRTDMDKYEMVITDSCRKYAKRR